METSWQEPTLTAIDMNAEIGAYQEDDPRDNPPIVVPRDEAATPDAT